MSILLFLDESGDHSLTKIDSQYPMFVLCGCIFDPAYHDDTATRLLNDFKVKLFGRMDIILHTADFTRNQKGFEQMREHEFRKHFFQALEEVVSALDYTIVACAIRKDAHTEKYGLEAIDPYLLSLSIVVERLVFECDRRRQEGILIAESRNPTLDNALELAFLNLKIQGTHYVSATRIKQRLKSLVFRNKQENVTGLQIADVVATPIGRRVLGKPTYASYSGGADFYKAFEGKFRKSWGRYLGAGLVVLPK